MRNIKGNKASKKEAGYIKQSKTNEKCINCTMWRDPNRCSAVKGIISPDGWCEWFEAGAYGKHGEKINEHGGRVVKGVNTTQDVGVDEIKKQAAKFGNKVDKDGYPPLLNKKAKKNTNPNTLYNLGLAENYTPLEIAIIEGGHSLEDAIYLQEDWKSKLKNVAAAGSLGVIGLGGVEAADDYNEYMSSKSSKIEQPQSSEKSSELAPKRSARPVSRDNDEKSTKISSDSDEAPEKSKRPLKRSLPDIALTSRKSEQYLINEAIKAGITGVELAAFLAQTALETNRFKYLKEIGDDEYFHSYDPVYNPAKAKQLGNTKPGDGQKYKGRGYIQLTGRYNYTKVGNELGIDLEKNPKLVEHPKIAAQTAIWYWKNRVRPHVNDFTDVAEVTKFINPRKKHLDKRKKYFDLYVETMSRSGKINESDNDIVDFSKKRKEKQLGDFHKSFKSDISDISEQKKQAYEIAYNEGLFDDLPVGARFTLPNGASYKVLSHTMTRHKTDELPRHQKEFRKKHNFGPAKFIEYNGYYYKPMVYAEEAAGEMSGSNSAFELDKLINFETGEKRYTKFTGPKKVSEKKTKQVKGKEKKPKKVKPSSSGQQPHPYRGRLVGEDVEKWYHGTPDVRNIRKQGGFEKRTTTVSYISDPEKWKELQKEMAKKRETDMKDYAKLIDEVSDLRKTITIPSPIFLTNKYIVAKTYADPFRAFDYGAEETVLSVTVDAGKVLTVDANGSDFRGIDLDKVLTALSKSGISPKKSKKLLMMFNPEIRNDKLSTDALAVIGHMFNFDTIDVLNVLDSYHGGKAKSTVRMVFDPSKINVLNVLNEEIGYKVMRYDPTTNMVYSVADDNNKFPLKVGKKISMRGKGIYLSNNEDFVKTYYSGLTDTDEVLLKIEYDPKDILIGNDRDNESEFTVPSGKIKEFQILSENVSKDFVRNLKENMSYTATYKKQEERDKGIEPGTEEWFEHWFSLPFMIDQRKKKRKK